MSSPDQGSLAQRLAGAHVDVRRDLEISRHLFRGDVSYVIRDPLTFAVHRLSRLNYLVLSRISSARPLGEIFAELVEDGKLEAEDEESFYALVMQLHRLDFLQLPVSDEGSLYQRYRARLAARRKKWMSSVFFAQVPLIDPDAFLRRTLPLAKPFFTRTAAFLWGALVFVAGWMLARNWTAFQEPVGDVFSGANLPLLWATLIVLKVLHEFGHAYACRVFGGHVPEMGAYLIVGTPCAYVDATSSWSFRDKRRRIVVCLAGMYVEVAIAAVAALVWCVVPPGTLRSVCHNVVLLSSFVTVAMNLNPLMRYDGYYALCDLLELPNLRARAQRAATSFAARWLVGVPESEARTSRRLRGFLIGFGIAGAVYKVTVVLGISMMIAMKFPTLGLFLAGLYIGQTVVGIARRAIPYLVKDEATAAQRPRAIAVLLLFGLVLPGALFAVPLPASVSAPGVARAEREWIQRAEQAAFLAASHREVGETVEAGDALIALRDPDLERALVESEARVHAAETAHRLALAEGPLAAREARERLDQARADHARAEERLRSCFVSAGRGGRLVHALRAREEGRFVERGEELARVADGRTLVTALFDADDLVDTEPAVGQRAHFQPVGRPRARYEGTIVRVEPAGTRELDERVARHLDPHELALDPASGRSGSARFEVDLVLDDAPLPYGSTGRLRLDAEPTPLGRLALRRLLIFVSRL